MTFSKAPRNNERQVICIEKKFTCVDIIIFDFFFLLILKNYIIQIDQTPQTIGWIKSVGGIVIFLESMNLTTFIFPIGVLLIIIPISITV